MDPTTLMTFLFKTSSTIRSVELLGSWDNFQRPYTMHHDRCRGTGFWSGCFKFEDIIFDGDRPQWTKPRSGGLKQGGTYWYYYRLDHDVEAYDESQVQTSTCPLLPGQPMNIIDVPVEIVPLPDRPRSANLDIIGTLTSLPNLHTLNPQDKFKALKPPPISKVHGRCLSDLALGGRLEKHSALVAPSIRTTHARVSSQDSYLSKRLCTRSSIESTSTDARASPVEYAQVTGSPCEKRPASVKSTPSLPQPMEDLERPRSDDQLLEVRAQTTIDADAVSIGPPSVQNVQFYGSKPSSSDGYDHPQDALSQHWRPRLHSLSNIWLHEHRVSSDAECDAEPADNISLRAPKVRNAADEDDNVEAWSPTFSVATLSSYGGLETPFGRSDRDPPPRVHIELSTSVDPSQHPQFLQAQPSPSLLPAPPLREPPRPPSDSMLQSYILPHLPMDSVQSLGKLSASSVPSLGTPSLQETQQAEPSSERAFSPALFTLPVVMEDLSLAGHGSGSLAQDIFSELGFLGASIV